VPLVSVVLIFLNEERFLEEAIKSVRDQTLSDWELILVDDGSTDRSTLIARQMAAEDKRIRYVDHPGHANRGAPASRNLGAAHATAPYVIFLDGDDVFMPGMLAEQVDLLESMPDVAMVTGAMLYWYSWDPASTTADIALLTGGMSDRRLDPPEAALTIYPLARETSAAGADVLVRRSVFEAVGGFEERFCGIYQLYDDQAFLIKVYLRYPVYISSRVWRHYRQHDASCVARTTEMDYWHVRGFFLDWLQADVRRLGDPRVTGALRRARREVRCQPLKAHALQAVDRLLAPLPPKYKDLVKRNLRRVKRKIAEPKRGMTEPGLSDGARPS
jgi:glycosyltransferase involved in cell wall biosynthesis